MHRLPWGPGCHPLCFLSSGLSWWELGRGIPNQLGKLCSVPFPWGSPRDRAVCSGDVSGTEEHSVSFSVLTVPWPACPVQRVLRSERHRGQCVRCSCCWEDSRHPTVQLAAFVCPNWIKAFKLLRLVKLCRSSSHMPTLVLPFPGKFWASG